MGSKSPNSSFLRIFSNLTLLFWFTLNHGKGIIKDRHCFKQSITQTSQYACIYIFFNFRLLRVWAPTACGWIFKKSTYSPECSSLRIFSIAQKITVNAYYRWSQRVFPKKLNTDLYKSHAAHSSLLILCTCVVVTVSAELRPLPGFGCFGLVGTFLGGEWVCFLQPMRAHRWGWEWTKHSDWTPFRLEEAADVNVAWRKGNTAYEEKL